MSDAKDAIIDKWRTQESADYAYFDTVEGQVDGFWKDGSLFRREFERLDLTSVVEIASGKGRHSAQFVEKAGRLYLIDTSPDALEFAARRFAVYPHVTTHISKDGISLPEVANASATAVFSYDAMVHFEPTTIAAYLHEIFRVLVPGGKALLHHSNYSEKPTIPFDQAPGWRNYMTSDLFSHFAHRAGLRLINHTTMDWAAPSSDALSLLEKAAP